MVFKHCSRCSGLEGGCGLKRPSPRLGVFTPYIPTTLTTRLDYLLRRICPPKSSSPFPGPIFGILSTVWHLGGFLTIREGTGSDG